LQEAAQLLGERALHRLVVVNEQGQLCGMVSAVDLLRALIGIPVTHPAAFPHYDRETGALWSDDSPLTLDQVMRQAPDAPGVLALIASEPQLPDTVVWVEAAENLASRLIDVVSTPQPEALQRQLERRHLRFRAAIVREPGRRSRVLQLVQERSRPAAMAVPRGR
jgi:hypothetical protein